MKTKEIIEIKFQLKLPDGKWFYAYFETQEELKKYLYENEIFEFEETTKTVMLERGYDKDEY